jgi:hypothetical protein
MSLGDISWGAVLVGAAAAVALVAIAPEVAALSGIAGLASYGLSGFAGSALVGGVAGEFLSDLLGKTGQAVTTIAGR